MSSCVASCSMCCPEGFHGSVTSDGWPIVNAENCFLSAGACLTSQYLRTPQPPTSSRPSGTVRFAMDPCTSSSGSPQLNSSSLLKEPLQPMTLPDRCTNLTTAARWPRMPGRRVRGPANEPDRSLQQLLRGTVSAATRPRQRHPIPAPPFVTTRLPEPVAIENP